MLKISGVPLRANRCQAHRSHKPLNSFSVDNQISIGQPAQYLFDSIEEVQEYATQWPELYF